MSAWNTLPSPPVPTEGPLWLRTRRRLDRMAIWSQQRMNTSDGFDPITQMREEEIRCKGEVLVLLLKRWEENQAAMADSNRTKGVD